MKIESQKAAELDAYISTHKDSEVGKWPLEIGGKKKAFPYYRIPLSMLIYNANNGRLSMDRREWEKKNGRKLDARDPADSKVILKMLMDLDKNKTETLKKDISKVGQMEPGAITHDCVLINGNRRMAILETLHSEQPTGKWEIIEAIRLPKSVSEKDLWKIEAGLQLSKDKVAEYHPVNELLKIKEGIDRKLKAAEVAAALYAWSEEEVSDALARLDLIDQFLEFFGQKQNYGLIKKFGLHEYFIDIQKRVIAPAKKAGIAKKDQSQRLKYTFALIRSSVLIQSDPGESKKQKGVTHWDIRKLDKVFNDAHASAAFEEPLKNGKKIKGASNSDVIEGFRDALDILAMREERNKPARLINKALKALNSIDLSTFNQQSSKFTNDPILDTLSKISSKVYEIQQLIVNKSPTDKD